MVNTKKPISEYKYTFNSVSTEMYPRPSGESLRSQTSTKAKNEKPTLPLGPDDLAPSGTDRLHGYVKNLFHK
jgi:hypothetical protein